MPVARRVVYSGRAVIVEYEPARGMDGIAGVAVSAPVRQACRQVVETKALPYALSISPVSTRRHRHYIQSFTIEETETIIQAMRRVAIHLVNTSPHAFYVEVGTVHSPAHRVLGKTIDHLHGLSGT